MNRQSSVDNTTSRPNRTHRTVTFVAHPVGCDTPRGAGSRVMIRDTPEIRKRRIRQHDELDLPLYQASLAADVGVIRRLCPQASAKRAAAMVAMARAFARIRTGWIDGAFYTVSFDESLGVWRPVLLFSGPVAAFNCAVCGRTSVYRLRDTHFCRMHGPNNLDRPMGSTFLDPFADRSQVSVAVDMPHNH